MKKSDNYLKIVEWSEEHQCYVGTCPGLFAGGGIYGDDEAALYRDLCKYAQEWVEILERDGVPLPEPTVRKEFSGKFVLRTGPELHKELVARSLHRGMSLNAFCLDMIRKGLGK
jgi:predicted HicB family RNase H-like nuclease